MEENLKDAIKPFQSRKEFDEWETNLMFLLKSKGLWKHIKIMRPTAEEIVKENVRDDPAYLSSSSQRRIEKKRQNCRNYWKISFNRY